jgi:hypothetical protein
MQLAPQSLVKSESGDLRLISGPYQRAEQDSLHDYLDKQSQYFDYLKPQSNISATGGLAAYADLLGGAPGLGGDIESNLQSPRFRNQRQRIIGR